MIEPLRSLGFGAALALGCLSFTAPAVVAPAAAQTGKTETQQTILTKDMLERWLASFPQMRTLALTQAMAKGKDLDLKNPLESVLKFANDKEVRAEADAAAMEHGFRDFHEWVIVTQATAVAYAIVKQGDKNQDYDKAAAKLIKKIDELEFLSEKQRRKLQEKAQKELGEGGSLKPIPQNLELVRSMEKDFDKVVKLR